MSSRRDMHRQKFNYYLQNLLAGKTKSKLFSKDHYDSLIQKLIKINGNQVSDDDDSVDSNDETMVTLNKKKEYDHLIKNYALFKTKNGNYQLILPSPDDLNNNVKRYVHTDELFDILDDIHRKLNHGNKSKMSEHIRKYFINITVDSINIYIKCCEICQEQAIKYVNRFKSNHRSSLFSKPLLIFQINLIDLSYKSNANYRFVLHYFETVSRFSILKPLEDDNPKTISNQMKNIFGWIGGPHVLISHLGQRFVANIIHCLKFYYEDLKIIVGKGPYHEPKESSQIEKLLDPLMKRRNTCDWAECLEELQFIFNSIVSEDSNRKMSPFEAFLGREPQLGLSADFPFPEQLKEENVMFEETLEKFCQEQFTPKDRNHDKKRIIISYSEDDSSELDNGNYGDDEEEEEKYHGTVLGLNNTKHSSSSNNHQNKSIEIHKKQVETMTQMSKTTTAANFCHCKSGCSTRKCSCRASNFECNQKCHPKLRCENSNLVEIKGKKSS